MKVQISFLGRARQDPKTGYRKAHYCFDNGSVVQTAFFGPALASLEKPDEFYVLGTAGSMWDVLLEAQGAENAADTERMELWERASTETVDEGLLSRFEPLISARLGLRCKLRIISYARDEAEQTALLGRLAQWLKPQDRLILDVTHGLRHLPMLMLAAAHYLERVRGVVVEDIIYGAAEMTPQDGNAKTPVLKLTGLLRLLDWTQALSSYDKDGDYGVFAPLLEQAGLERSKARALTQSSFYERIHSPGQARGKLRPVVSTLRDTHLGHEAEFFKAMLIDRLVWCEQDRFFERQSELARKFLASGDYLRAALMAFEALITKCVQELKGNAQNYDEREAAKIRFEDSNRKGPVWEDYVLLRDLRNALAHGVHNRREVQSALASEDALKSTLARLIRTLV